MLGSACLRSRTKDAVRLRHMASTVQHTGSELQQRQSGVTTFAAVVKFADVGMDAKVPARTQAHAWRRSVRLTDSAPRAYRESWGSEPCARTDRSSCLPPCERAREAHPSPLCPPWCLSASPSGPALSSTHQRQTNKHSPVQQSYLRWTLASFIRI
jgi:hypothetical protein